MISSFSRLSSLKTTYQFGRYFSTNNDVVVRASNLSFGYVHNSLILDEASFSVRRGSKVTIMGQNGAGKSTIIKLTSGVLKPISGTIMTFNGLGVATAQQVLSREDGKLTVTNFFRKQLHGNDSGIESRIAKALLKVHINVPLDREVQSFSGGQQARLLLAAALIQDPDILLLDEPTNNLDTVGIDALTEFIQCSDKTCIVISHDEDFLNCFSDSVLYLDSHSHKIEQYQGNYIDVKKDIQDRIRKENSDNARLEKLAKQKKEQANMFANKGGNMRKVAKKLRETAENLEADVVDVRKEDKSLKTFKIPLQTNITELSAKILEITGVSLLHRPTLPAVIMQTPIRLHRLSKIQIKGPNGIGKTTFLDTIHNKTNKYCKIAEGIKVGYYRQDFSSLDFNQTVLDSLRDASNGVASEQELRATAAAFLITRHDINKRIGELSEGQKGLVSFARLVLQQPGLIIVDEPTNHINFRHLPAIAAALKSFEGAMVIVSHDKQFMKSINVDDELDLGILFDNNSK
eukprot:gene3169-6252_t